MNGEDQTAGLRQLVLGAVLLACAAALGYDAAHNAELMAEFGADPGPSFQPVLMLYLLAGAGVFLVLQGLFRLARAGWRVIVPAASVTSLAFPVLMVASLVAYVGLVEHIGFFAVSLLFTVSWAVVLVAQDYGLRQLRPHLVGAGGAVFLTALIYLVFRQVIGVPLD